MRLYEIFHTWHFIPSITLAVTGFLILLSGHSNFGMTLIFGGFLLFLIIIGIYRVLINGLTSKEESGIIQPYIDKEIAKTKEQK
jgi:hypothetical protein